MNNPKLKAIQDKWYAKLEKSGFKDIEQDEDHLKVWSSRLFTGVVNQQRFDEKRVYYQAREEYYKIAGWLLNDHLFKNKKERLIWELHAEGKSIRAIVAELKRRRLKAHTGLVQPIIKKLIKLMKETYVTNDK